MTYEFRDGARSNAKPLIGIYSESGCGKTYGALLLARGFVGPNGKIGMIESEGGRGEAYADPAEYPEIGGYQVCSLRDNFSPEEYGKAITAAEEAKLDALLIDSASHEWQATGGVLDMAEKNAAAGRTGVLVWQKPKQLHNRHFMLRFTQTPIPLVILCMRAKYVMQERPDPKTGKRTWVRDEHLTPIQADDILSEMFVHGWIDKEHRFHMTKNTARKLEPVFAEPKPLSVETGQQIAKWAAEADMPEKREGAPSASAGTSLIDRAREATVGGSAALQRFWEDELTKQERKTLQPELAGLKKTAKEYDELANQEEDIPFDAPAESADGQSPPETQTEPCIPAEPQQASGNGVMDLRLRYIELGGEIIDAPNINEWQVGLATQVSICGDNRAQLAELEKLNADILAEIRTQHPANVETIEKCFIEAGGQQKLAV